MTSHERRGNADEWPSGEARAVTVVGLKEGGNGEESDCNARDLSMLFRLQGPEALAEVDVVGARYPTNTRRSVARP